MDKELQAILPNFASQIPPRLGLELEMFAYDADTLAPLGTPGARLTPQGMMERVGALVPGSHLKVDKPTGVIVGLELDCGNFSLEPGGQLEYASCPHDDLEVVLRDLGTGLQLLEQAADGQVLFLDHGTNPIADSELPLLVPKHRYKILDRYFASQPGGRGTDMMRYSATAQPNVDVIGRDNWLDAIRLTLALTPLARDLFANSRYFHGQLLGQGSERQRIWAHIDATRTGIPPVAEQADLPRAYADWGRRAFVFLAGDLPLEEQPRYGELTFEQWQDHGYKGTFPTPDDWNTHLGTLFPDLRLRGFLEVRMVDAQPFEHALAPMAFWAVALQEPESRKRLWHWLTLSHGSPQETLHSLLACVIESCRYDLERQSLRAFDLWIDERERLVYPQSGLEFVRAHATAHPSRQILNFQTA